MNTATTAEREAVATWLADSLNQPGDARRQWTDGHVALLALGRRFSAVRLTAELVYAVAIIEDMAMATTVLHMMGGPVIHDPRNRRFYALVPSSPPGQSLGPYATYLGLGNYVGVPRVGDTEPNEAHASYWAVPMKAPGALCDPIRLNSMVKAGTAVLDSETKS
ncbi:hypothetical protein AB0451_03625 [Streptomyces sp. NPDC052000]|uniref:hypothetical protein n=1 Tax=Streptomyces sp. NPDC052000 TaxID=3155676 RepID=UPI003450192B